MSLLPEQSNQCNKVLTYKIFFEGHDIGNYQRRLVWNGRKADIYTNSSVNMLMIKAKMDQQSKIHWSSKHQSFITDSFQRNIKGIMTGKTSATFSDHGTKSIIVSDGKTKKFNHPSMPILDGDAIGSQMRLNLMQGKKTFDFILQNSDDTSHYYFKVVGNENIKTNFGNINTIRVDQIKKKDRQLSLWFAPSIDYQLVRATYKRKLLDLKAVLVNKSIHCPKPLNLK